MGSSVFARVRAQTYVVNLAFSAGCSGVVICSPAQAAGSASSWDEAASKKEIRGGSSKGRESMCVCVFAGERL